MKSVKQIAFISLLILLQTASLLAVTHEVYPDSGLSIQATVLGASNGDSVIIHDGEYIESVVVYGRGLFIGSEFIRDGDSTHIANTIIRADTAREDTTSCFVYAYGEHPRSKLCGLTLTDGRGTYSTVSDVIAGGGIYVYDSSIQIESCVIQNCSAFMGGGIAIRGRESHPEIQKLTDCTIRNCSVVLSGGGMHAHRCSLFVSCCEFTNNESNDNAGGGLYATSSYIMLSNTTYSQNSSLISGGVFTGGVTGMIMNCSFIDNYTSAEDYAHLTIYSSDISVTGCLFGSSPEHTNSITIYDCNESFRFQGNIVENSITTSGFAGTLMASETNGEFAYNIFRDNHMHEGCVLYFLQGSEASVHHNVFENNLSVDPEMPSVLFAINEAQPSLDSNIIRNNSGQTVLYDWWQPHVINARNNWWGHESGPFHPSLNPEGLGDTIYSDMVDFIPWLTEPPDTTMPISSIDPERPQVPGTWHIMNLFPNPFNSEFTIILAGFTRGDFSIRLYDILGREAAVIYEGALTGGPLTFVAPHDLASGVYFLRAVDRTHMDTRKVVFLK